MIEWMTVVVAVCLGCLVYFLVVGLRMAFSRKDLPDAAEGDYNIKVVGKLGRKSYLAVMSKCEKPRDKT